MQAQVFKNLLVPLGELDHRVDENGLLGIRVGQQIRVGARFPVEQLNGSVDN